VKSRKFDSLDAPRAAFSPVAKAASQQKHIKAGRCGREGGGRRKKGGKKKKERRGEASLSSVKGGAEEVVEERVEAGVVGDRRRM
jgi:hypothetical protein